LPVFIGRGASKRLMKIIQTDDRPADQSSLAFDIGPATRKQIREHPPAWMSRRSKNQA
jgi:hypothetical protein